MANLLETKRLQDGINLVLAACLFVSPWVLGFAGEQVAARTAWAGWRSARACLRISRAM